jgi:hypothetical protein
MCLLDFGGQGLNTPQRDGMWRGWLQKKNEKKQRKPKEEKELLLLKLPHQLLTVRMLDVFTF